MKKIIDMLIHVPLFYGMSEGELESMIPCLNGIVREYQKDSAIFLIGDQATKVGIVLAGTVQIIKDDLFGNRTILASLTQGELFGETFACAGIATLPVSAIAQTDCQIFLMDYRKVITRCPSNCQFHNKLIENMLKILALKNMMLKQKIEAISSRTIRDKLLTYLLGQAEQYQKNHFLIPFNRQELADYLSVDRSAMSSELGRMRDEGIIKFHKNQFEILINGR